MTIITNNHPRDLLSFSDFSEPAQNQLRRDFDWLADIEIQDGFFSYRGSTYHLSEFMRDGCPDGWDGVAADSYFSGVVVRLSPDCEAVTVGLWLS